MTITILSAAFPFRGGIAHFNGLLYKELAKSNQVDIVNFKRQYPSIFFPGKSQVESGQESDKIPSQQIVDSINPFNWIRVGLKIKKEAPDLLIFRYWLPFFGPCFGTISKIVKRNKKTKVLVIADNVMPHEKKPGDAIFTKYFFSSADHFILLSEAVKQDLLSIRPEANYKLLYHPVYSNFGEAVQKEEAKKKLGLSSERNILFFGFIRKYKGLDTLLRAAGILKSKIDLNIIVAGEFYEDGKKYLSLIDELAISDMVHLHTDFIPTGEVKYYFSAADVVVLPYKDATQSGIVQIANNFRKPVIVTKVGGLSEVVEDNVTGFLVEKDNPEALAESILKFYSGHFEEEFSKNISAKLNQLSWSNFAHELIEFVSK